MPKLLKIVAKLPRALRFSFGAVSASTFLAGLTIFGAIGVKLSFAALRESPEQWVQEILSDTMIFGRLGGASSLVQLVRERGRSQSSSRRRRRRLGTEPEGHTAMMGQPSTLLARRLGIAATAARSAYSASQTWRVTRVQTPWSVSTGRCSRKVLGPSAGGCKFFGEGPKKPYEQKPHCTRCNVDPIRTNKREVGVGNQPR